VTWDALASELGEPITLDALTVDWRIAQRAAGHRHSIDDVLVAHRALLEAPHARTALDLGAGIGGVGLLVLWGLPPAARLACVEAQAISHRLLCANIAGNGLAARVDAHLGDLRELALAERFPLVTGSPPYFPVGTGVVPADSQKAHARFELRGDVADYARAAALHLADGGAFVFCFPTPQADRALAAALAAGFGAVARQDVIPRAGRPPLFSLFACRREGESRTEAPLVVREADGTRTEAMHAVRARFGFPRSTERA
jgi:tRNA1Val (adenine37-N6)-methyltransferase